MTLVILGVLAAVVVIPAVIDLIRRADLRRVSVRNAVRRPTESALIILGSALGTAIILAALLVGATFRQSIRDIARAELGEVDVIAAPEDPGDLDATRAAIAAANIPGTDGLLSLYETRAAISAGAGNDVRVEPNANLSATDFSDSAQFGSSPETLALRASVPTPQDNEIVVNKSLAEDLRVAAGDSVDIFAYDVESTFVVTEVIPDDGLAGFAHAWVDPGIFVAAEAAGASPWAAVLISNDGLVYDSTENSDDVEEQATAALEAAGIDAEVFPAKADQLADADEEGDEFAEIFTVVGGFSVLAGILLLVNLIVMLAEERKPNLGVLRAVGWKRSSLVRAFGVEGLLYAIPGAIIGSLTGIGLGWVLARITRRILFDVSEGEFEIVFAAPFSSILTAALVGLVIAMGTIWITSMRISRLNIISAIRALPEPKKHRSRLLSFIAGALAIAAGALAFVSGVGADNAYLALIGLPLVAVGASLVAKNFIRGTLVAGIAGSLVVVWAAMFFLVMPTAMTNDIDITFFLLFGVVAVCGGVAVTTVGGPLLQRALGFSGRPLIAERIGMAYPVARIFRTASSLAMYSLIIFSLAFMAVMSGGIEQRRTDITKATSAGHDIVLTTNRSNVPTIGELAALDGVATVSEMPRGDLEFGLGDKGIDGTTDSGSGTDWDDFYTVTGVSASFADVGAPTLKHRSDRFGSDVEALQAVASSDNLIFAPWWMFYDDLEGDIMAGTMVFADPESPVEFEVVGVLAENHSGSGVWMGIDRFNELVPDAEVNRFFIDGAAGTEVDEVVRQLEATFIRNGADADGFAARVDRNIAADLGMFGMLRSYLLLGLVIGIAGLAVTLLRAVRERRRQIGMMRAMGFPSSGVRRWFMTEATFVSVMGIATGVVLGLLTGWLVTSRTDAITVEPVPFSVSSVVVLTIVGIPFVASTLAAIIPALRASNLRPSEALRLAD